MIKKENDNVYIYFLENDNLKTMKKGIIALLVLQVINIIYILIYKLNLRLFDLSFSYIVVFLIVFMEFYKRKMNIPNIVLKDKKISFGEFNISVYDVLELKIFSGSLLLRYKVSDLENMVKIYSSDSKKKIKEVKNAIEDYIKKFKKDV